MSARNNVNTNTGSQCSQAGVHTRHVPSWILLSITRPFARNRCTRTSGVGGWQDPRFSAMRGAGVLVSFREGAAASGLHGKAGPLDVKRRSADSGGRACTRRRCSILGIERHIVRDGEPGGWICRAPPVPCKGHDSMGAASKWNTETFLPPKIFNFWRVLYSQHSPKMQSICQQVKHLPKSVRELARERSELLAPIPTLSHGTGHRPSLRIAHTLEASARRWVPCVHARRLCDLASSTPVC